MHACTPTQTQNNVKPSAYLESFSFKIQLTTLPLHCHQLVPVTIPSYLDYDLLKQLENYSLYFHSCCLSPIPRKDQKVLFKMQAMPVSHLKSLNSFLSSLKKNANYHQGFVAYVIWTLPDPPGASKAILSPLYHHWFIPSP